MFKPAAFFKGVLLPLAMENCTMRESTLLSSVLTKVCHNNTKPTYLVPAPLVATLSAKVYVTQFRLFKEKPKDSKGDPSFICFFSKQPVPTTVLKKQWQKHVSKTKKK